MTDATPTTAVANIPPPTTPDALPGATPDQIAAAQAAEARLQQLLAMGDVNQANAATCIFGDTGTGKSVLLDTAIEYCWNRYHKISRIVGADLGGFGNKRLRLIRLGICQVYNPLNHIEPFETIEDLSRGYWPETILDPYTGVAAPDVKLIAPERTQWVVYCQQGHEVRVTTNKATLNGFSQQCPVCKAAPVTPASWGSVQEQTIRSGWIKHVGLYGVDSGTATADWAMEDMSDRAAKSDPTIKDGNNLSSTGARIMSGKYAFGANTQPHYGFAQNAVRRWIKNSRLIPGQVLPPIWTFLEDRGSDENKGISVFGPKIPGNAKTSIVPSWFGNCLHTTKEPDETGVDRHALYLVNHTDRNSAIPHLAKTRAEPGTLPPKLVDGKDDPPFTRFSLGYFFDQLETALISTAKADAENFPDAPAFLALDGITDDVVGKDLDAAQMQLRPVAGRQVPTAPGVRAAAIARPTARPTVVAPSVTQAAQPAAAAPAPAAPQAVAPKPAPAVRPAGTPPPPARPTAAAPGPSPAQPAVSKPAPAPAGAVPAGTVAPPLAAPATQHAAAPVTAAPVTATPMPAAATAPPGGRPPTPSAVPRRASPPPAGGARKPQ